MYNVGKKGNEKGDIKFLPNKIKYFLLDWETVIQEMSFTLDKLQNLLYGPSY